MLNERRYDYVEATESESEPRSARRRFIPKLRPLPVGGRAFRDCGMHVPMQAYLAKRFASSGRKCDPAFRALQAENQRRHDLAATRGSLPMSRTS